MAASKGLVGLIKRGWNEVPAIMASGVMGLIGIGLGFYGAYQSSYVEGNLKRYRRFYTIYREDDPKVEELRKFNRLN